VVTLAPKSVTETSATVQAQINPQGSETSWEIYLECQAPLPSAASDSSKCQPITGGPQRHEGRIAANAATEMVQAEMTGLQPGYSYTYSVIAGNSAGREGLLGVEFGTCLLHGSCPTGGWPGVPLWNREASERASAEAPRIEAELEAKKKREQEEQAAHERAIREAGERAGRDVAERELLARGRCVVPRLKGDSLVNARKALRRALCKLGNVIRPSKHHRRLVVHSQSVEAGRNLDQGSSVSVRLGLAPATARRRHAARERHA
jgi:hypothetical protein